MTRQEWITTAEKYEKAARLYGKIGNLSLSAFYTRKASEARLAADYAVADRDQPQQQGGGG